MFGMLTNLSKAIVSVAIAPVALVVDIVTLPASAENNSGPFDRTTKLLDNAGECIKEAVKKE
jgi:hypothetical protein